MRYQQHHFVGDIENSSQHRSTLESVERGADMPHLLTLQLIRRLYLPIGERTVFRLMATGKFPQADIRIGGKLRLWRRDTIEQWIAMQAESHR